MNYSKNILAIFLLLPAILRGEYRPLYHFTAEKNWINDPNGMVYYEGEYHLFYQYNPQGDKWGHMSWGHAVSTDLISWKHLPLAIPETKEIMAFSGSAVVDWNNTSGFGKDGKPPLLAIYTGHRQGRQDQRLAFSNDRGRTWTQYEGNPVLDINKADFRDPKVFWYEPSQRWIMALSLSTEKKVSFYGSKDLKKWQHLSDFGPVGAINGIWECPDLFELPVAGMPGQKRWVLLVNMNPGAPAGGSGCQYFVGDFDGSKFTLDSSYPSDLALPDPSKSRTIADFENGDYGDWKVEGESFGLEPSRPEGGSITGFKGAGIANSFGKSDASRGTLTSPRFVIKDDWLAFRIAGGNQAGKLGVRLRVGEEIVRSATGNNSPNMEEKSWDLRSLRGKTATLEIFDNYSEKGWGHTMVDDIRLGQGSAPAAPAPALWLDYGADCYAIVSWSDIPKSDGRRIGIGWMNNWLYAEQTPTSPWRGAMTLPREFGLVQTSEGIRLTQKPVAEVKSLAKTDPYVFSGGTLEDAQAWLKRLEDLPGEMKVTISFSQVRKEAQIKMKIGTPTGHETIVGYENGYLIMNRIRSGNTAFHPLFAARHEAPYSVTGGKFSLDLYLDRSSLELFTGDGRRAITNLIFPDAGTRKLHLESTGPAIKVERIVVQPLAKDQ